MRTPKQLKYLASMDVERVTSFAKDQSLEELQMLQRDISSYIKPKNGISLDIREKLITALSYIEAVFNAKEQEQQVGGMIRFVDTSKFKPMSSQELIEILGITIKQDKINKLVTFMTCLSAFTEDSQLNMSFNAPSSSGKSYIPIEVARLFPHSDVIEVGYCSPTAFFHSYGSFDREKQGYIVDLSRKIIIFLDQPHQQLLAHLRPVLSHDKKEITIKVTDKTQKFGLKTKDIYVIGFPAVIFCTAGLKIDEQEATRMLLLSPEISQEKIRDSVYERVKRESDKRQYYESLNLDPSRLLLTQRILAVKQAYVSDVVVVNQDLIKQMFFARIKKLKPKHSRDMGRLISLTKLFALLNLWFRDRDHDLLFANDDDIKEAFTLWDMISESQELNLPPYVFNLYKEVIVQAYKEKNEGSVIEEFDEQGLSKSEVQKKHYEVHGRFIPDWQFRQEIIPMLETAGLIRIESDSKDKRKILIYPTMSDIQNNSELDGGVNLEGGENNEK